MQLFVAPVSINMLHIDVLTLVGKVVPCSVPIITSLAWIVSYCLDLTLCQISCCPIIVSGLFRGSHCSSSVKGISLSSCSRSLTHVVSEACSSSADSSSIACSSSVISCIKAVVCLALSLI